jgi:hypothetical protein
MGESDRHRLLLLVSLRLVLARVEERVRCEALVV